MYAHMVTQLSDVKTMDRQQTLMHFLAEQVAANYPEVLTFYEGVNLAVTKGGQSAAHMHIIRRLIHNKKLHVMI